ncbi:MAG: efflux RND transporter permease subunit, partial [Planctomycetota bacterium]
MDRLAILFGRHRLPLACFVLVYTGLSLFGLSRLTFDSDPLRLLRSDKVEFKELDADFAHLERTTLIVVEGDDLLTPEGIEGIGGIVQGANGVSGVEAVYSMLSLRDSKSMGGVVRLFPSPNAPPARFVRARRRAESHPLLVGHLLSEDMKTSLVIVQFDASLKDIAQFKPVLAELKTVVAKCTEASGIRARITGSRALQVEIVEDMSRDIDKLSFLGAGLVVVIAVLLFRRVGAALLVASGPTVGTIWTVGTLGLINEPINMLTNIVPVLVLVIGFTDSMHLVLHVRRSLAEGSSSLEAAQSSVRHLGLACGLTSLSTAVGFGSLTVAGLYLIKTFGWCCALGSVLSFLAVITVVPLLASTPLSRYVVAKRPSAARADAPLDARSGKQGALGSPADWILSGLLRHPRLVLACGGVVTIVLVLLVTELEPDHTIASEISHSSEAYRALEHVDKAFGGVMFAYATVDWPEQHGLRSPELYDVLEEVHQVFDRNPALSNPLSVLNLVKSLPGEGRSLSRRASNLNRVPREIRSRLLSPDQRQAVVSAHMPDVGARRLKPAFEDVERQFERIAERYPGFRVELTGGSVTVFRNVHLMIEDLWRSLMVAAVVMFLMIWIGFWSLRYALVSVVPNVLPLLCAGSFIVLSGRYLEMSSVIVFSISLGVAVDDTIHFLVRFKREIRSEADPRPAVRRTFKVVGTALVMTTVALVAGHGVVMLSSFPAIRV